MGINQIVELFDDAIFKGDNLGTDWCEVEGHAVITLDVHEGGINCEQRVTKWSVPEVSVELTQGPVIILLRHFY